MPADHFARYFPTVCAGFGLFLAGGVNLLLIRRGILLRALATLAAVGIAISAAAAAALNLTGMTGMTARLLAVGLIPFLILGSRWFIPGITIAASSVHRPVVRCSLLVFVGAATMVGSIMAYVRANETHAATLDDGPTELELLQGKLAAVPTRQARATTDRGTDLVLKEPVGASEEHDLELSGAEERILRKAHLDQQVIRRGAVGDRSNCHGWVFTGGRFLMSGADVELILKENGYREDRGPRAGDLVVYRQGGVIVHTAVVRYVSEGEPVLVESKWGELGVFLHPADKSPYGSKYTFHRSTRHGHLLAGIGGPAAVAPAQSQTPEGRD
jgi:hypothetical protein